VKVINRQLEAMDSSSTEGGDGSEPCEAPKRFLRGLQAQEHDGGEHRKVMFERQNFPRLPPRLRYFLSYHKSKGCQTKTIENVFSAFFDYLCFEETQEPIPSLLSGGGT
jgi:hypothetical protein